MRDANERVLATSCSSKTHSGPHEPNVQPPFHHLANKICQPLNLHLLGGRRKVWERSGTGGRTAPRVPRFSDAKSTRPFLMHIPVPHWRCGGSAATSWQALGPAEC